MKIPCTMPCLKGYRFPHEIVAYAVWAYYRFSLSTAGVEDLLHERGIDVSYESVRFWWNRFGPKFASEIRRTRTERMRAHSNWQWHLDEVFVKITGETHYMWRLSVTKAMCSMPSFPSAG